MPTIWSKQAREIGSELHTDAVLIGRIAQRGDELTIGMKLDDVCSGKQHLGKRYIGKFDDLGAYNFTGINKESLKDTGLAEQLQRNRGSLSGAAEVDRITFIGGYRGSSTQSVPFPPPIAKPLAH